MVPAAGIRGFLDASEYGTWMKDFQSVSQSDDETKQNVKHFLLAGQVNKTISLFKSQLIVYQSMQIIISLYLLQLL